MEDKIVILGPYPLNDDKLPLNVATKLLDVTTPVTLDECVIGRFNVGKVYTSTDLGIDGKTDTSTFSIKGCVSVDQPTSLDDYVFEPMGVVNDDGSLEITAFNLMSKE